MALIEYEQQNHIVTIAFNRPERLNALGGTLRDELCEAWVRFDEDPEARVAILTGRGRAFCAGRDLKESLERGHGSSGSRYSEVLSQDLVPQTAKPTIAAVHGYAIAAGFVIALGCDMIVAAEGTKFQMQQLRHGGTIGHYSLAILEQLPWQAAMEMLLGGVELDARRAHELGFVNHVVPPDQLLQKAGEMAANLAALPPLHLQRTKQLLTEVRPRPTQQVRELERETREFIAGLEDTTESMKAWVERRPPVYRGR